MPGRGIAAAAANGHKCMGSRHRWLGAAVALLASAALAHAQGPALPEAFKVPLEVTVRPDAAADLWSVSEASLGGQFESIGPFLIIANRSSRTLDGAHFYGRYYDEAGRLVYTSVYSQDVNYSKITGPFQPGQGRALGASASVAPAVRPKRLELRFLDPSPSNLPNPEVTVPPTVGNGRTAPKVPRLEETGRKTNSLALVEARIGIDGRATSVKVGASASPDVADWAARLVSSLRFEPAAQGPTVIDSSTLLLIRSLDLGLAGATTPAAPVWDDPWVRAWVAANGNLPELPVVQMLEARRMSSEDAYEYYDTGTGWCSDVLRFWPNPSGHGYHLEWFTPLKSHDEK